MATAKATDLGEARLRELGFDSTAPPEQAVATLKSFLSVAGVGHGAIAHALGNIATPDSAALLAEMEAGASGAVRREIRRALYRLHQRGIEAPAKPFAASPSAARDTGDTGLSAVLSPADVDGMRIVWLMKSRAGGGLKRLWGLVSETEGLVGASFEPVSRKELRADRAEMEQRAGAPLVDADWRLVDFILCDAYRRTPDARRGRVGEFLAIRAEMIAGAPLSEFSHPVYDEFAAKIALEPSFELMQEAEIAGMKLPADAIKPFADEVAGLRNSVIVLSRVQQEERINAVVERAIGELLTGETAYRIRRHLEDTAYIFARIGKTAQAGWATAAAARIRDGADLKRVAFFQAFMRMQVGGILAEQEQQERQEPRLIMTPAEAMQARQAAAARMRQRTR